MANEEKGVALVILGIIAIVAIIGIVLLFSGGKQGAGAQTLEVATRPPGTSGFAKTLIGECQAFSQLSGEPKGNSEYVFASAHNFVGVCGDLKARMGETRNNPGFEIQWSCTLTEKGKALCKGLI